MGYIVEIEPKTQWLAKWSGDPGRTAIKETAKTYKTEKGAKIALSIARKYRPFLNAKIVSV